MMSSILFLPEDLLVLVLTRLPVKTLMRFRCVSKSWNVLILSASFGKMHHHLNYDYQQQQQQNPPPQILVCNRYRFVSGCNHPDKIFEVDSSTENNNNNNYSVVTTTIHQLYPPLDVGYEFSYSCDLRLLYSIIIGSCDGLLCVVGHYIYNGSYYDSVALYNPLTRTRHVLPQRPQIPTYGGRHYGFGYDDVHDDYKVIRITSQSFNCLVKQYEYEVYRLRSNSWSRRIRFQEPPYTVSYDYLQGISGILVNHALHWLRIGGLIRIGIHLFDLRLEKLMSLPIPESLLHEERPLRLDLITLNGCLCLKDETYKTKFDLWVMKDYGLPDSWTRITIDVNYDNIHNKLQPILHIESKKQMVFYPEGSGGIVWHDLVTGQVLRETTMCEAWCRRGCSATQFAFVGTLAQPWLN